MNSEILDRLPPQNLAAERQVLSSVLLMPKIIDDVAEVLRPNDFYADANRIIFETLLAMREERKRIDSSLLLDRLRRLGKLGQVGGAAYLVEVAPAAPHAGHAVYYAEIVARCAKYRAIIHAATEMLSDAYGESGTPESIIDAGERAMNLVAASVAEKRLVTASEAVVAACERMEVYRERKNGTGLFTGLSDYDNQVGGLFPEFIVLAARSGIGKTALGFQIADYVSSSGRLVYAACLEMDAADMETRMICSKAQVDSRKVRTGTTTVEEDRRLALASNELGKRNIVFDEREELKVSDIRRQCRRLMKDGLSFVVIDYIQILDPDDPKESRERQVATMSKKIKAMQRELKVPVLVLCQTNRDAEKDKQASLRHLRESDAIGHNADVVWILETGAIGTPDEKKATLTITKNRNGPKAVVHLFWRADWVRFACDAGELWETKQHPNYRSEFDEPAETF